MVRVTRMAIVVSIVLLLSLAACAPLEFPPTATPEPEAAPEQPTDPLAALIAELAAHFNAGDLDAVMNYYADDATVYFLGLPPTGLEVYRGAEQIRPVWADNMANHLSKEVEIDSVYGDVVKNRAKTWHDFTRQIGVAPLNANEVWVIHDGKIVTHVWAVTEGDAMRIKVALAEAMPEEPAPEPAAETPVSEITITFADGTCSYDGPLTLQSGEIQVNVDVLDEDKALYALTFFTLNPDKDFMDLMASTVASGPPDWAEMISLREINPGTSTTYSMTVNDGPVYGVCWSQPPDSAIGNVGPFAVEQ